LVANFYLDSDIILHIIKSFTENIRAPKKDWIRYEQPVEKVPKPTRTAPEYAIIEAPLEPPRAMPPYVEPLPFPEKKAEAHDGI
jgi:hypothetical protein